MAKANQSAADHQSTIEKIKQTARSLFMEKGYAQTTVRDIAGSAGINLALLNYYFRSKENLFELVMKESIDQLFSQVLPLLNDESTGLYAKLELLAERYTSMMLDDPNLPLFVLGEIQSNPQRFAERIRLSSEIMQSVYVRQLAACPGSGTALDHLISYLGLLLFPFIIRPVMETSGNVDQKSFVLMVEARRHLAPVWMASILGIDAL